MNQKRILISVAWVATVVVAYVAGGSGNSPTASNSPAQGSSGTISPGEAAEVQTGSKGQRSYLRSSDEVEIQQKNGRPKVSAVIGRARAELANGMMGMNIRSLLKAMAPLADLNDEEIQEALVEVTSNVKEQQQRAMFYSILLGQWAESDGRAAMKYAMENIPAKGPMDFGIRSSLIGTWARKDPDAAWRWYRTEQGESENDMQKGFTTGLVFTGMAASNLDMAFSRLSELDETSRMQALSGIAGSAKDETSRQRLLERSAGLPKEQRTQIYQTMASQWTWTDPDAAVAWMRKLPQDEQKPLRQTVGSTLMMQKPAAGAELLLEGADEKEKPQIYDRIVGQWVHQDQRATGEWLSKQPQGPELDNARRTYAVSVVGKDPAAAMDWAKSVQKEDQRTQSVEQVFQQWRTKDAGAAEAALEASGIPQEKINALKASKPPEKSSSTMRFGF